jgi:hypothetical protein
MDSHSGTTRCPDPMTLSDAPHQIEVLRPEVTTTD